MTPKQITTVQESWGKVKPIGPQAAQIFYQSLFEMDPSLKPLFKGDMIEQGSKLMTMLDAAVKLLNDPDKLIPALKKLGERHLNYGVKAKHYDTVGAALLKTLEIGLGDEYTVPVKRAWTAVYKILADTMIDAANAATTLSTKSEIDNKGNKEIMDTTNSNNELAVRLQGALDQSATPIMMVDRDFIITYVNAASLSLLQSNEATFAKVYPGFSADKDKVLGACIDMFHKNPAHQRKLLDDVNNLPWQTDIKVAHLTFSLNVTAILDSQSKYIGNSLEWQDVTEARTKAIEVGRLSSAIEGMTTNLMMADTDGKIVYCNPAVIKMLARRETELRSILPAFSVATVVGTNFDSFHKDPAHQQNLLGNIANLPFTTEISVGSLTFQLIAIALKDENENHVGTAVQWLDLTEEKDAQSQVEGLITAAISGELDRRIDTTSYSGFMLGLGNNINELMEAIVEPINDAINIAQALADGDLTQTMDSKYGGQFLLLADAMNGSIENLGNMVEEIRSASTNVFDAAREIAEGNNELSQRTETQASSLEETASAMEELTSTVQQNAENTTEASKLSSGVMDKATNGGEVVKNAIEAMSDINKSSKKIADIISVIDEIAFQTNLLALNAAVEAARAGEQGRGFAVVAAEVRNLAQRSAGAAKEIKGLINDSVEAVGQGTKLVDATGQTFTELVSAIAEVGKMLKDIDSAGKEQSAGIGEVSEAVSQMDEMTQQNAALVEEASASSKSMEEQAQGLLEQISFFKCVEVEPEPVTSRAPARRAPVGSAPAKTAQGGVKRETATRPPSVRRATKSDDDWKEF
ncbi:methyl-accepting chemotaxis protein [Brumicola pallidula]|jgi:methyl-accepting chemotaxis protein|uniref:Methyl-accepting chemotaxis protein n=1 Tax=Brumicola pallidula DSM 14239 = ACAM 615 TaxID=1121922 RepID=K6YWZ2_9ALTE|nr:methyl-accepting chemotaxis protein [Glaciecola pallidula]GAC28496.1 methyl-accepting chemotaxis protein [Glaciecola pallidula DSM 14239 = ACAM 615]